MFGNNSDKDHRPLTFEEVIEQERQVIDPHNGRDKGGHPSYTALCLSGGGIRSATFNLGIIQGLAKAGLLKQFDYLSTVSGGGYIGGWLSAWIARSCFPYVNQQLAATQDIEKPGEEPEPIQQLRNFSNYLSPKLGLMDADTWTLAATFIRNMLLNWSVIIPLMAILLILPRFMIAVIAAEQDLKTMLYLLSIGGILVFFSVLYEAIDLPSLGDARWPVRRFQTVFLAPFIGYAVVFAIVWGWYVQLGPDAVINSAGFTLTSCQKEYLRDLKWPFAAFGAIFHVVAWLTGLSIAAIQRKKMPAIGRIVCFLVSAALSGAVGGYLLIRSAESISHLIPDDIPAYACFAAPLFIGAFLTAGLLQVAIVNAVTEETDREWWASSAARPLIITCIWLVGSALVYYGPQLLFTKITTLQSTAVSLFGILSGAVTAFCGHSDSTSATAEKSRSWQKLGIDMLMSLAAVLFIAIFLILLTLGTSWLLEKHPVNFSVDHHILQLHYGNRDQMLFPTFLGLLFFGGFMGFFVHINRFSLHCMYRNRLIRAYLGASRRQPEAQDPGEQRDFKKEREIRERENQRDPNKLTGFDQKDNIKMTGLEARPFHIVNIALNLAGDEKLSWQQRKAESFTISPLHAGGKGVKYRPIKEYSARKSICLSPDEGLSLGTAIAISGAAASPNMGYHSSPLVTFIMALFNLRLGWWLGNPGPCGSRTWRSSGPKWSAGIMFREMFGRTSDHYKYVYLSDGGHFENLGLYEMALRRCRQIVVIDAGCDEKKHFEDLGNAIRKIRIDLFATVTLDLKPIIKWGRRYVTGTIDYPAIPGQAAMQGRIVYIKPVVNGNEPPDILNYRKQNTVFPHEPTSDQWFSESQFESYRMLGFHTIKEILRDNWQCPSIDRFG
ncbi:patatin-like phospholipase family protein [Geobacter pelophilus]|uniref:Patatin-like phospholipase family protein n=1 Tax=Geoanaerobacter pelophilus TaxID=60036 RepID=A0AAW4L851_9BACT|nr:patatin-like phospholipase family protein [Geoanaerobacter pelophilus]MBT0666030.1 patatin-like phospholipase family protein [Geoanaerobacter pelophilus]